jgi:hypothetical protein
MDDSVFLFASGRFEYWLTKSVQGTPGPLHAIDRLEGGVLRGWIYISNINQYDLSESGEYLAFKVEYDRALELAEKYLLLQ